MFFQNPPSKATKPRIIIQTKTQNFSSKNAKPRIYLSKIYKTQNYFPNKNPKFFFKKCKTQNLFFKNIQTPELFLQGKY